ncbi:radical SAM protein [Nocardia jiangsuensis]|uniref:Radical SAM protein n=1 Tax=Nocardia jiangsuensis TaxID=1691563 RepID=A0ABV8DRH6_9NOCA
MTAPTTVVWELAPRYPRSGPYRLPAPGAPRALDTAECRTLLDEFARLGVVTVEVSGGEPTGRADFADLAAHASARGLGLAFHTDGTGVTPALARQLAGDHRRTARVALAAPTEAADDAVRGPGAYRASVRAMELLASAGVYEFEVAVPLTRHSAERLDALLAVAGIFGARLRLTGDRPPEAAPDAAQRRAVAAWVAEHRERVRFGVHPTGDLAEECGAGRDICLVDVVGDVFACPVARGVRPHGNVRDAGGFAAVARSLVPAVCPAAPAVARPA